jgi:hypothetical protein
MVAALYVTAIIVEWLFFVRQDRWTAVPVLAKGG